jgi:hypothetical protein
MAGTHWRGYPPAKRLRLAPSLYPIPIYVLRTLASFLAVTVPEGARFYIIQDNYLSIMLSNISIFYMRFRRFVQDPRLARRCRSR